MRKLDKNQRLALMLLIFFAAMIALSFASVPLYRIFCKATGFGGTTQRVEQTYYRQPDKPVYRPGGEAAPAEERTIMVTFDANVDRSLPWAFTPEVKNVRVKLGEPVTIKYLAYNKGPKAIVGTAVYNVQPDKAGSYFNKIQCFCFTDQVLKPYESIELPVQFFVDSSITKNREADDVKNITLSYTFFPAKDQSKAQAPDNVNETDTNSSDKRPKP